MSHRLAVIAVSVVLTPLVTLAFARAAVRPAGDEKVQLYIPGVQ